MCNSIGGVTQKHAIKFYVQLAFGEKAKDVFDAKNFDDLVRSCLRASWGPAFKHVSDNTKDYNVKKDSKKEEMIQGCINDLFDKYCAYFEENNKSKYLSDNLGYFQEKIKDVKEVGSNEHPISLGHFQKLFNMTTKHLLTLYMLRKYIWGNNKPFKTFKGKIKDCFENADCPIDSKILENLYDNKKYNKKTWSQFKDIKDYDQVQSDIQKQANGNSNLYYDFENW